MKMGMHLVIQRLQKSLNVLLRQHWSSFVKEQAIFDLLVHKEYREKYGRFNFRGKKVKIIYTLYFKTKQRKDYSNYAQKMIDDSLVKERIIDDDNSNIVVEETVRIRHDENSPRTEVDIIEASF